MRHRTTHSTGPVLEISPQVRPYGTDGIYIEWLAVPKELRGRGLGTKAYKKWEKKLPREIRHIYLHAADSGEGPSNRFWESLGFEYVHNPDSDDVDDYGIEALNFMHKSRSKDRR